MFLRTKYLIILLSALYILSTPSTKIFAKENKPKIVFVNEISNNHTELTKYVDCFCNATQMKVDPTVGLFYTAKQAIDTCKPLVDTAAQAEHTSSSVIEGELIRKLKQLNPTAPDIGPRIRIIHNTQKSHHFGFKGILIGEPATPNLIQQTLGVPCGNGSNGAYVCNGTVTIANSVADMNLVINNHGNVQRIMLTFPEYSYEDVSSAIINKFGNAEKISTNTVTTLSGAIIEQIYSLWKDSTNYIEMLKYAGVVDRSYVKFYSQEELDMQDNQKNYNNNDL